MPSASAPALAAQDAKEIREKQYVLLKPRCPQFDNSVNPAHVELLQQARILRSSGKSDFDIAQMLDKLFTEQWDTEGHAQDERRPPITVDVVKSYLTRGEMEAVLAKPAK